MQTLFIFFILLAVTAQALNVTDVLTNEGYPHEVHRPVAPDGYVLTLIRITGGKTQAGQATGSKPVVYLQHGLLDDCATWVVNPTHESLGFILADLGYEVWLGNVRGNSYSSVNLNYTTDDSEYWEHADFDYMISQDLPTMLGEALRVSGQANLSYVGHSQGTLIAFGAFCTNFELAKKVNFFGALAPVAFVGNTGVPLLKLLAGMDATGLLNLFGERTFLMPGWLTKLLSATVCGYAPELCNSVFSIVMGSNPSNLNMTRFSYILSLEPGGTSVQNMAHWSQLVNTGTLGYFDFHDQEKNIRHYNSPNAPQYPLHEMKRSSGAPPMAFFTGSNDPLSDVTDDKLLAQILPEDNKPVFWLNEPTYDHLDFVWGVDAHKLIYPDLLRLIKKYNPGLGDQLKISAAWTFLTGPMLIYTHKPPAPEDQHRDRSRLTSTRSGILKGRTAFREKRPKMPPRRRLFKSTHSESPTRHTDWIKRMREDGIRSFKEFDARYRVEGVTSLAELSPRRKEEKGEEDGSCDLMPSRSSDTQDRRIDERHCIRITCQVCFLDFVVNWDLCI
ncbi:lysosomal acid lipase/cholesteryl ester hydrolase-like [Planoprotostelium fungivorum]|uniref:Lysosomal acid lipase/cholesteryl ester hydrolase-like n=1 Tax=Planoprotostelium fungivorum TaxID=1890364 RepID=A0A2P6N5J9_9EUKA|nr:lysosomal acid lipase/cholesteryl ester hydrolase-like [Planoprotostelium fungivorum]